MKKWNKKILTSFLCMMLMVVMALCTVGCNSNRIDSNKTVVESADTEGSSATNEEVTVLGEGTTVFTFTVTDKEDVETIFEIHTEKEFVGEALLELDLIAGEEGSYGLYVKNVNGITADYNVDGTYWAFYVNGEYAASGVDTTTIKDGESYMFKVEK